MMVQHHEKYEEIHGEDKIVMMEYAEHRKLHARLRKEGKCTIPSEELHEIAMKAYRRTEKGKAMLRRKEAKRDKGTNRRRFKKTFSKSVDTNIELVQIVTHYPGTRHTSVASRFKANVGRKLIYLDI